MSFNRTISIEHPSISSSMIEKSLLNN